MLNTLLFLIRDAGRFALYTFVLGPALALYVLVMLEASHDSLSRQFLTAYHDLTDGAPAGKVMGCVNEHEMVKRFSPPEPGEKLKPAPALEKAPPEVEVLCQRGPVDSDSWVRSKDSLLWNFWILAAMFGSGLWLFSRGLSHTARKRISPDTHSVLVRKNRETQE